ncbi:MAG TPA: muconolactone Delta-isomerase family protein, partial [Thermoleophilaceae bacterium]
MKHIGVSTPLARCGVEMLTPTSLDQQKEDSMEFLVEFELGVPPGTPHAEVEQRQRAESAAAAKLAGDGHLVRLWRRPLVGDGTTSIGVYRA